MYLGTIKGFVGGYEFLNNFYEVPFTYKGLTYHNSEAAYQAQKCINDGDKIKFTGVQGKTAKFIGQKLAVREDWDKIKIAIMYDVCRAKFKQNKWLMKQLVKTKGLELINENTCNETFWGTCKGIGENNLGKLLMRIRDEYIEKEQATGNINI